MTYKLGLIGTLAIFLGVIIPIGQLYAGSNLLQNAGFETQGSWSEAAYHWELGYPDTHGGTYGNARRADWRHLNGSWEGAICGLWMSNPSDINGVWQEVPATSNQTYTFSAWFWSDHFAWNMWTSVYQCIKLEFFDINTNLLSAVTNDIGIIKNVWAKKRVSGTSPANTAWTRAVIHVSYPGQNAALQFDDLSLVLEDDIPRSDPTPASRTTPLVVSEIMYHPPSRSDGKDLEFIEFFNTEPFSLDISGYAIADEISYTFPANTIIGPESYLVVAAVPTNIIDVYGITNVIGPYERHLSNSDGTIEIADDLNAILLQVEYGTKQPWPAAADGGGCSLILSQASYGQVDPRAYAPSTFRGGSPGRGNAVATNAYQGIFINEFLAHTDDPLIDYIELYNATDSSIDLTDCVLTDDPETNKFLLPPGSVISAHDFIVFDQDELGFNLTSDGEQIFFYTADGSNVIDAVAFPGQQNSYSCGRYPDGSDGLYPMASRTAGAINSLFKQEDILINEIMYHPISGSDDDEYIELYNAGSTTANVGYYRLSGGVSFTIPSGTTIGPGAYLVIAKNATNLIGRYPQLTAANCIGDYSGKLADGGEQLLLLAPDTPDLPTETCFYLVDDVIYYDGGYQRGNSDGGGSSLELRDPHSDNLHISNWSASDEKGKSDWTNCTVTGTLNGGQLPSGTSINTISLMTFGGGGECLVDDIQLVRYFNYVANGTFETTLSQWSLLGNHIQTSRSNEGYGASSYSLHIKSTGGGDTRVNCCVGNLISSLGTVEVTLSLKARWLAGSPVLLMWVRGGYLEMACELPVPTNLGTPGQQNSCYIANEGPTVFNVNHAPVMPQANEPVTVYAQAYDPDDISGLVLKYRIDPSSSLNSIGMTQDAYGVYSAEIPGQLDSAVVAFHIEATDQAGPSAMQYYPEGAPEKECLVQFGNPVKGGDIGQYTCWMSQTNMALWKDRYAMSDEPLDITFVCGERIIYNADIRFRGSPFIRPGYGDPSNSWASYRIGFPKDNTFLNSDELSLDRQEAPDRDTTFQRERACMWIGHKMGLPMFYKRYITMMLNGMVRGIVYSDSQGIDADYVKARFPDVPDGDLHKINDWFEFNNTYSDFIYQDASLIDYTYGGVKQKPNYRWNWEKKKVSTYNDDYTNLYTLVDAANLSGDTYTHTMENLVDVNQWMGIICFRHLVGDWDSFGYDRGKNMMGFRPDGGKWLLYPWDVDFCLGSTSGGNTTDSIFQVDSSVMPRMDVMINHPPFKRYYRKWFNKALTDPFDNAAIDPVLDECYAALVNNGIANSDGQPVDNPSNIKSWISARKSYIDSELDYFTNITLNIYESNFTTSSNRVTITGQAPVQCEILKVNDHPCHMKWSTSTKWEATLALTSGVNNITVTGCDADGIFLAGQSDSITITCLLATDPDPADHLVINEIMYHPAVDYGEFIEIYNTSTNYTFDLYNFRLNGIDLTFETTTLIAPNEYLVVVESAGDFSRIYSNAIPIAAQWAGTLDNGGETITLQRLDTNGLVIAVIDKVTYDDVAPWPVEADGTGSSLQLIDPMQDNNRAGNWTADTTPQYTPGAANSVTSTLPVFQSLWLNEIQSDNASTIQDSQGDYDPWIEIYNAGTGTISLANYYITDDYNDLTKWPFPGVAAIDSTNFLIIWADEETYETAGSEYHASFILSPSGGNLALVHSNAGHEIIVDYLDYGIIPTDQSFGDYPDGVPTNRCQFYYATPGATNNNAAPPVRIYINEWMAKNDSGIIDPETGTPADWFELYNAESYDVDITGYALSDNPSDPTEFIISGSLVLTGGEYRLVWADDTTSNAWGTNDLHVPFKLSASGDDIAFFDTSQTIVDTVSFGNQDADISQGRYPDATPNIVTLGISTPRAMNRMSTNPLIFASAGAYGTLSPTGLISVVTGSNQAFSIVADTYYGISDILTNGITTGGPFGMPSNTYTWVSVQTDGTFYVEFSELLATNGVPQWWLALFGWTNNFDAAALDDPDHDQVATWAEYVAGTDPTNTASVLSVDLTTTNSHPVIISWPSVNGRLYTLEYTTNASAPYSTLGAALNLPATPDCNTYTNTSVTNAANLFYRIKVKQQ